MQHQPQAPGRNQEQEQKSPACMDPLRQEGGKGGTDKAAAPGDIRNIIAALDERNPKPGYGINKNNLGLVEKYLQNTLTTRDNFLYWAECGITKTSSANFFLHDRLTAFCKAGKCWPAGIPPPQR